MNASNVSIGTLAIARGGTGADSASAAATALGLGTGDQPSFVTLNTNVNASNVVSTDIYGTIQGSNTISSSTVNAITLNANVNASNIVTNDGRGINQLNASNVSIGTLTIARGGTGYDSYVEGQILMANTVGGVVTLTKLTPGTSGHFLKSQGAGSHLEWASVADIGSATPGQLIMGDYLTGGPTTLAEDTTIHADASNVNTADKLVARDVLGDIYVSNVSSSSNVNAITLKANVIASNVVSTDIYGTIQGSNTVTAITVTGNVNAGNVVSTDIYGTIQGSNTVTAITLTGNVNAGNVVSTDIYGTIKGSNTVTAITLNANVNAGNVVSTDIYGTIKGSNTVTAITVTGNVAAGNVVSTDIFGTIKGSNNINGDTITATTVFSGSGASLTNLPASELTGDIASARLPTVPVTKGGTGLSTVTAGDILYASADDTIAARAKGTDGQFLTLSSGLPAWASVSSTTMGTTDVTNETGDHGLIFVSDSGTGAQALKKEYGTLKYKPSTGTLTTSNVITSDTSVDARNGIANTTPTHTLSVGTVVSIRESASGDVFIVRKGDGYFSENVYIAKKLTIPVGGEILADTIKCRSFSQKGTTVVAERIVDDVTVSSS